LITGNEDLYPADVIQLVEGFNHKGNFINLQANSSIIGIIFLFPRYWENLKSG